MVSVTEVNTDVEVYKTLSLLSLDVAHHLPSLFLNYVHVGFQYKLMQLNANITHKTSRSELHNPVTEKRYILVKLVLRFTGFCLSKTTVKPK